MSLFDKDDQRRLLLELSAIARKLDPQWTDANESDPGTTLLALFSWLADSFENVLAGVSTSQAEQFRRLLARVQARLPHDSDATGLTRVRYFDGQFLSASDFQTEQNYHMEKRRLYNRFLLGSGIAAGLEVTLQTGSAGNNAPVLTVSPGMAVDMYGRELFVLQPLQRTLQTTNAGAYVLLRCCEKALDPVPTSTGSPEPTRIREEVVLGIETIPREADVTIAHLETIDGQLRLDPNFKPDKITPLRTLP